MPRGQTPSDPGRDSQNATDLEFSLIWVFHLKGTDLMPLSEQTTGTRPPSRPASTLACPPSAVTSSR